MKRSDATTDQYPMYDPASYDDGAPSDDDAFFKFAADVNLSLGNIHKEIAAANAFARNQQRLAAQPNPITLSGSASLVSGGVGVIDFGTPQDGRVWTIRQLIASGQGVEQFTPGVVEANTAAFTAGSAGSVGLPSGPPNGVTQYITGFTVTIAPATAAGTSTITLNNVSGGPLTYTVTQSTTQAVTFSQTFASPGLQVTGTPTLTISATVNGGTGNLTLYGTASTTPGLVNWYIGPLMAQNNTPLWRWQSPSLPRIDTFTTNLLQVRAREHLYALISGGIIGQTIIGTAVFLDEAFKRQEPVIQS